MSAPRAIAIVGVAGRFPGASDLSTLWRNVLARQSAVREVPERRWPVPTHDMVSQGAAVDRTRSSRAGLLDPFELDTTGLDLPAELIARLSPLAKLTLQVGADTWHSAKLDIDKSRVGIVLANIALPTDGASKLAEAALLAPLDAMLESPVASFEPLDRYSHRACVQLLSARLACHFKGVYESVRLHQYVGVPVEVQAVAGLDTATDQQIFDRLYMAY